MKAAALLMVLSIVLLSTAALAGVPGLMSFQGTLTDSNGVALDTTVSMTLSIYTDSTGGIQVWTETQPAVVVSSGLFNVLVGRVNALEDTVFHGLSRWLEVQVGGDPELVPRQRIAAVGYAFRASDADTAEYARSGGGGGGGGWVDDGTVVRLETDMDSVGIGTTNPAAKLDVEGDALIHGKATIGSGHTNTGTNAFVAGQNNTVDDTAATVGGGRGNTASRKYAVVSGGHNNDASGRYATVGGGSSDTASASWTTVSGGESNVATQSHATVGGGENNQARGISATVAGGEDNVSSNSAATVGGGFANTASGQYSAVAGGRQNYATGYYSVVGGGRLNLADGDSATVAGGGVNKASGDGSTVGGGKINWAIGPYSTVGGGAVDTASGAYSTVPGGRLNKAAGDYSFAAGLRAKANHNGCFIWADDTNSDFASTGTDQFLIRASSGLGIYNSSNTEIITFLTTETGTDGGQLFIYEADSTATIDIDAEEGSDGGGIVRMYEDDGTKTVHIDAQGVTYGGAQVSLSEHDGTTTISFDAESGSAGGAFVTMHDNVGTKTIHMDANGSSGGAQVSLIDHDGTTTISLDAESGVNGGANAKLLTGDGIETIRFDADYGGTGEGRVITSVLEITGGSDLSEQFEVRTGRADLVAFPGMVVCIDPNCPGELMVSSKAYDSTVAGIISGAGGIKPGMLMGQTNSVSDGQYAVALTGRVYCRVDASYSPIKPGDLLTTSDTPGYAMKVTDHARAQGAIIGKAMSVLEEGRDLVLVLVTLQ